MLGIHVPSELLSSRAPGHFQAKDRVFMAGSSGGHSNPALLVAGLAPGTQDAEKLLPFVYTYCFQAI